MRVLVTGATGFIGSALLAKLHEANGVISVLTRHKQKVTQDFVSVYEKLEEISADTHFDLIVNLAGAPISKRWSKRYKRTLIDSRVGVTEGIYALVQRLHSPPKLLISASAVGYYGSQSTEVLDEASIPNAEFTHTLCHAWEQAALKVSELGTNVKILRLGVVLGKNGGMLKETAPLFKMCLGGKIGSGQQYLSWVHIDDVVQVIQFLSRDTSSSGIYNLTAPNPVSNAQYTQALAKALNRPAWLPMPSVIVRLIFGEMGKALLLSGQHVVPKRLLDEGYVFRYAHIESALYDIFGAPSL